MMKKIAKVLLDSSASVLDGLFDYLLPETMIPLADIGARVMVSFGRRTAIGYIWEFCDRSELEGLKSIIKIIDIPSLLSAEQLQFIEWMASYYFCNRAEVAKLCLPPGSQLTREQGYKVAVSEKELLNALAESRFSEALDVMKEIAVSQEYFTWTQASWKNQLRHYPDLFDFLRHNQLLKPIEISHKARISGKTITVCKWAGIDNEPKTDAESRVKQILIDNPAGMTRSQLSSKAAVSLSVISRLIREKKLTLVEEMIDRLPDGLTAKDSILRNSDIRLNAEQRDAYHQIQSDQQHRLFLLHGVTGSGKTEVYFELAEEAINSGLQVLYLVPEISLTPQTLKRAQRRFQGTVALLHSNMSDGERYDQWFKIKRSEAYFVLGARSALFAPFTKLGLIIVDEEHETTYKQEESPRYHVRQAVEKLAELTGAKVVFGSATPALESFYAAESCRYRYIKLQKRYNQNSLPEVSLVDMREELKNGNKNIISVSLKQSISDCLALKEQVILLLNRRGHSTFVLCRDCGRSIQCPACEVSLTYHAYEKELRCHYCDYRQAIPDTCPNCQSARIRYFGQGTQKLEFELKANFDGARIVRMDLDSTARKGSHQRLYRQLADGDFDILLGTQMIAKGLDLPRVTLVGVISADSTLNMPDFRAAERLFQLLTQVAGRAGRGDKPGRVIFQTYSPDHYSLQFSKNHDYQGFYETEIENRRLLKYPPFSELFKFGFSGPDAIKVAKAAELYGKIIKEKIGDFEKLQDDQRFFQLLGPAPALVAKVQNRYRYQIILKTNSTTWLEKVVASSWNDFPFKKFNDVRIIRDRNPYSVL